MRKNYFSILLKILGILFLLFLAVNFGINFWLKTKLPGYIKNNSDYKISYHSLDVDLGTGNIYATGISVNNKNPENQNIYDSIKNLTFPDMVVKRAAKEKTK